MSCYMYVHMSYKLKLRSFVVYTNDLCFGGVNVCGVLFVSAHNDYAESWVGYITLVTFGTEHKRSWDSGFTID